MMPSELENDYWVTYWTRNKITKNDDLQYQVTRTVNNIPIDPQKWQFTLNEIERTINLSPSDNLLDLCAGKLNHRTSIPLSCATFGTSVC